MEFLKNYQAFESKNKLVDLLPLQQQITDSVEIILDVFYGKWLA